MARGASGRWSQGSAKKINDGSGSCQVARFNRLYLFLDSPSIFQVNIFRFMIGDIASDSWSDKSEGSSLKEKIFSSWMTFLEKASPGQLQSTKNSQNQQNVKE